MTNLDDILLIATKIGFKWLKYMNLDLSILRIEENTVTFT
jgi:hypothetical protein